jgi:Na+/H+ antiporter 1
VPIAVRRFLDTEAAGWCRAGGGSGGRRVWAKTPWHGTYESIWDITVTVKIGTLGVREDLQHLINDGLMSLFFVVVALEIKRELVVGDLRDRRVAALPAVAAAGGMVVPAGIDAAFTRAATAPLVGAAAFVTLGASAGWPPTALASTPRWPTWPSGCWRRPSRSHPQMSLVAGPTTYRTNQQRASSVR